MSWLITGSQKVNWTPNAADYSLWLDADSNATLFDATNPCDDFMPSQEELNKIRAKTFASDGSDEPSLLDFIREVRKHYGIGIEEVMR